MGLSQPVTPFTLRVVNWSIVDIRIVIFAALKIDRFGVQYPFKESLLSVCLSSVNKSALILKGKMKEIAQCQALLTSI